MDLLRFALTGDTGKKPSEEKDDQKPVEVKKVEPEKNKMEFSGSISSEKFEEVVAGGKDAYGHYKNFHGDYREKMEKILKEIVDSRKKEGRSFDKEYIHSLAKKLHNEPDQASRELAKVMGYK